MSSNFNDLFRDTYDGNHKNTQKIFWSLSIKIFFLNVKVIELPHGYIDGYSNYDDLLCSILNEYYSGPD